MKKSKVKNSDDILRLDNNCVLKEIGRMGPCNKSTRCYYCRDWSLLVHKKQLLGKQQEQPDKPIDPNQFLVKAGTYSVAISHSECPDTMQKSKLPEVKYDNTISPLKSFAAACTEWTKMPNRHKLPSYLLPLEFDTTLSAYTIVTSAQDSSSNSAGKLLQQLVCDRQGIPLTPEQLKLLIGVDHMAHADVAVSGRQNCCTEDHFLGCTSPSDLETERAIINESMAKCLKEESAVLGEQIKCCWAALVDFMDEADVLDREFGCLVGPGLSGVADGFMKEHDKNIVVPFQDYWTPLVPGFKKKTSKKSDGVDMLVTVDNTFISYMDQLLKAIEDFYMNFIPSIILARLEQFNSNVENTLKATHAALEQRNKTTQTVFDKIQERVITAKEQMENMNTAKKRLEDIRKKAATSTIPSSIDDDLQQLEQDIAHLRGLLTGSFTSTLHQAMSIQPGKEEKQDIAKIVQGHAALVHLTIEAVKKYASEKWKEQKNDIEQLKHIYLKESLPNVASRVEKVAHKEFRKKIKKIEQRYGSMRQGLRYMLHSSLVKMEFNDDMTKFKENASDFYNVMIKTMETLLREGEILEAITINSRAIYLGDEYSELIEKRAQLQKAFAFGIFTGQQELATVIKILVLAESKRLLSDNEAIQREISLTKSMGGSHASGKKKPAPEPNAPSPLLAVLTALSSDSTGIRKKVTKIESVIDQQAVKNDDFGNCGSLPDTGNNQQQTKSPEQSPPDTTKQRKAATTSIGSNTSMPPKKDISESKTEKISPPPGLSKPKQPKELKISDDNQMKTRNDKVPSSGLISSTPISEKKQREISTETVPLPVISTVSIEQDQSHIKTEKATKNRSPDTKASRSEKQDTPNKPEKVHSFSRKRHEQTDDGKSTFNPVVEQNQVDSWNTPPTLSQPSWEQSIESEQPTTWNETCSNIPSTTWSQAVARSKPQTSTTSTIQQTDSQNSGWGQTPAQQTDGWAAVETSGWGNPVTVEKEGWPNDWATKAKAFQEETSKEDLVEPQQINVSLKDILANSQEVPSQSSPSVTVAPPPALGYAMPTSSISDVNQLYHLNQESLVNMITSLRCENQQLQQSMASMQQALSMTMTLAKEREEQTMELFNRRKQADLEEARMYILSLESKIKELESHTPSTNAFINQDLFADYRQEIRPESSESYHRQHYNNGANYQRRPPKKPFYKKSVIIKCSNCGQADHTSGECKDSCRYCGSLDHLSENCTQAW